MKDLKTIEHNCYACGYERTIVAQAEIGGGNVDGINTNALRVTYLSSNTVEVIYECKYCNNSNKVVINL